jgi:hypothetical protein
MKQDIAAGPLASSSVSGDPGLFDHLAHTAASALITSANACTPKAQQAQGNFVI